MTKYFFLILTCFFVCSYNIDAQVGIGTTTPDSNAALEISSNAKGVLPPRMTTAQRNAIYKPTEGMFIYNTDSKSIEWWTGISWFSGTQNAPLDVTSGGTGTVGSWLCFSNSPAIGVLIEGVPITLGSVTKNIGAYSNPSPIDGTYNITTQNNGITFSASGNLSVFNQSIQLQASGTPIAGGTYTFTLNTTPACTFTVGVQNPSSGGTALFDSISCAGAAAGNLYTNLVPSAVTQSIIVNAASPGTYNLSATSTSGINFAGSGSVASAGIHTITLTASGMTADSGDHNFTVTTTPSCSFTRFVDTFSYKIGDTAEGGIVVKVDSSGLHGLVASLSTVAGNKVYCNTSSCLGATDTLNGLNNSTLINASCGTNTAAGSCLALVQGGYSDWYLPTVNEFRKIYEAGIIPNYSGSGFWTSLEISGGLCINAKYFQKSSGTFINDLKNATYNVIAVRQF